MMPIAAMTATVIMIDMLPMNGESITAGIVLTGMIIIACMNGESMKPAAITGCIEITAMVSYPVRLSPVSMWHLPLPWSSNCVDQQTIIWAAPAAHIDLPAQPAIVSLMLVSHPDFYYA